MDGLGGLPRDQDNKTELEAAVTPHLDDLAKDSIFMMPHLGVLATVHEEAAMQVFWRDCLVPLGVCIAPRGAGRPGRPCMTVTVEGPSGAQEYQVQCGELKLVPLASNEEAHVTVEPARGFDCGAGRGRRVTAQVQGGEAGIILDGRGRPLQWPEDETERRAAVARWIEALDAYPQVAQAQPAGSGN